MIPMNKRLQLFLASLSFLLCFNFSLSAQISEGGEPLSFTSNSLQKKNIQKEQLPKMDVQQLIKEDKKSGRNFRFAAPINVDFNINKSGTWTKLKNGDRVWRLAIQSEGAEGIAVMYDDFYLPEGTKLFMYSADKKQILGAYTSKNNKATRKFITGLIFGDEIVLEVFEPAHQKGNTVLNIFKIQHAYDREKISPPANSRYNVYGGGFGFGTSLACHLNVNCDQGQAWQNEKRGVVRIQIVVEEGMGWCSGSLMNNTAEDGRPYVLGAFHCQDGFTPMYDFYRFDFNYESIDCSNPIGEPEYQSIVGCDYKSGLRDTDFALYEITSIIPNSYQPYFNGWNRTDNYRPESTTHIHHPSGDIKKISIDNDVAQIHPNSISWNTDVITPANHHLSVYYEEGTFEGGSSGSPLFDNNGHVVGQLNGGTAGCTNYEAFFGRFDISWDTGENNTARLSDWLDPLNTGQEVLNGLDFSEIRATLSGIITTEDDKPVPGVTVHISNTPPFMGEPVNVVGTLETGLDGIFTFENVPKGANYYITAEKDDNPTNGVTTFDIVRLQKVILGFETFDSPYKYLAGDVNESNHLSTLDIILIRRLILDILSAYPDTKSWLFVDSEYEFPNMMNIFDQYDEDIAENIEILNLNENHTDLKFIAVKKGDMNNSVDVEE